MTIYNKKSFIIFFCLALLLLSKNNASLANIEVVKATTIKEEKVSPSNINFDFSQYDYYEFDEFTQAKDSDEPKVIKGFNFFKKKKKEAFENENITEEETPEEENTTEIQDKTQTSQEEQIISQTNEDEEIRVVQQPIKQTAKVDNKNKFYINANKVTYDDSEGNVYADGDVEIISKAQGVVLKADKAILDKEKQQIFLNDNVKILKGSAEMRGESLIVDLNEENILMDNPNVDIYSFTINAQEGYLIANDIQLLNGTFRRNTSANIEYMTRGFMRLDNISRNAFFGDIDYDDEDSNKKQFDVVENTQSTTENSVELEKKKTYKINAKEIVITSHKDHNTVLLKDADVFYNNHKIIRKSDFEIVTDKQRQVVEANIPEIATLRGFGTYLGYGMVFKVPNGHTLKLMPVVALYEGDTGIGIIGRYRSRNGIIDGGWNNASSELVVRGKHNLGNGLSLNYGRHAYMPEGFMGARRSGYAAQLQYRQSYNIKDLNARFSNGIYAGVFSDYTKRNQSDAFSTTRFRYMAQLSKSLFSYKNEEQSYTMQIASAVQGAATVYGTGETHGVIRVGPTVTTRFKRWESSIGYFLTGEHGESPFWFDKYRYGKSTVTINEKFHFNDKFALGFRLFITPMRDNYQDKLLTESRFYAIVGPKDLKLALSYDFVRAMGKVDFMFIIGSDTSKINFDKLITKDFDGKKERKDFYQYIKPVKIEKPENI